MSQKFIKSKNNNLRSTAFGKYFTRGSWEREAIISNADTGNQIIHDAEHATRVYRLWERNPWMGE